LRRSINRVAGAVALWLAAAASLLAGPQYFVFNLAATGVANADATVGPYDGSPWYEFHGGAGLAHGDFTVNLAAKTSDPALTGNSYLQNVPFSVGTSGDEGWSGRWAAGGTGPGAVDLSLAGNGSQSLNVADAQVVFLMMNTFWGTTGASAEIHLRFAEGGEQVFTLYGNSDLRDHNDAISQGNAYWTNQIDSNLHGPDGQRRATVNETTEPFRYAQSYRNNITYRDVVMLFVDPAFGTQHLTQILIRDTGTYPRWESIQDPLASRLWLWGVTVGYGVAEVPEPSTWLLVSGGLVLAALWFRRR
jgi:hypothetical protein